MTADARDARSKRRLGRVLATWFVALATLGALLGPRLLSRAWSSAALLELQRAQNRSNGLTSVESKRVERRLERALRLDSANSSALRGLGVLYIERGDLRLGVRAWRDAGVRVDSFLAAAEQAQRSRAFSVAARWYGYATVLAPKNVDAWYNLGLCQERLGAWDAAAQSYREGLAHAGSAWPGLSSLHMRLGIALAQHTHPTDPEAAIEALTAALEADAYLQPLEPLMTLQSRAKVLVALGRSAEALADCEAALAISPDQYWTLYALGELYVSVWDDADAAVDSLQQAIALDPKRVHAPLRLAALYERLGDPQAALRVYRQVLSTHPNNHHATAAIKRIKRSLGGRDGGTDR
jgi:tetratricopeptide (TPR) repeat protein